MTSSERPSRRGIFLGLGLLLNAIAGLTLAVPILRYLFSPVSRGRKPGSRAWVSLGRVKKFPAGQTRFATYRNPVVTPSDGETATIPCWVRNIDGERFQIFAINCAHLGCPVRWFPQSNLFMCPCHGGAYYADGSRASGPPERGLFEYRYRVDGGTLFIEAGAMPTPGASLASLTVRRPPCA
jgi:menaquinol-cytochrome c reductase iron-sulfur subunit